LSLIFPICERTALFKPTLQTLTSQTLPADEFEVIIIDDGGTDPELLPLLRTYRAHGLQIRYVKIDIHRLEAFRGRVYQHGIFNDSSPALNLGMKMARGERVVLSSPEVMYEVRTNLDRMESWPLAENHALICDVFDPAMAGDPQTRGMIGGGPGRRPLHFLGVYNRDFMLRIGGFEEEFLTGWGYQDTEFAHRFRANGGEFMFSGRAIRGFHQPHPRVETADQRGVGIAKALYERLIADPEYRVANVGRDWGSESMIVERDDG
jgi:hypothetical protein